MKSFQKASQRNLKTILYRDPIHGDIELSAFHRKIIDTPEFQRLGRIKQLGYTDMAYRGATHTRLAHSIGVYWLSKTILETIKKNHERFGIDFPIAEISSQLGKDDLKRWENVTFIVSTAALLHDITHIPIGHTLEDEFEGIYIKHDKLYSPRLYYFLYDEKSNISQVFDGGDSLPLSWTNEATLNAKELLDLVCLSCLYREERDKDDNVTSFKKIIEDSIKAIDKEDLVPEEKRAFVKNSIMRLGKAYDRFSKDKCFHPFFTDIISNTVCADMLDYLKRDAHYTGLGMAYDPRIVKYFLLCGEKETKSLRLALKLQDDKGTQKIDIVSDILNLMDMRYNLALKVYYHKSKVATSIMLAKALSLMGGIRPRDLPPDDPNSILNPEIDDDSLLYWVTHNSTGEKNQAKMDKDTTNPILDLIKGIRTRKLYKAAFIIPFKYFKDNGLDYRRILEKYRMDKDAVINRTNLEVQLAKAAGYPKSPHYFLLHVPPFKEKAKAVETRAIARDGYPVSLWEHELIKSDVEEINNKQKYLWNVTLFVHPDVLEDITRLSSALDVLVEKIECSLPDIFECATYGYLSHSARVRLNAHQQRYGKDMKNRHPKLYEVITNDAEWGRYEKYLSKVSREANTDDSIETEQVEAMLYLDEHEGSQDLFTSGTIEKMKTVIGNYEKLKEIRNRVLGENPMSREGIRYGLNKEHYNRIIQIIKEEVKK